MSYMFIAYCPNSRKTFSDYVMDYDLDGDGLIEIWAKYLKVNFYCSISYQTEYIFHVFRDGRLIFNETVISCDDEKDKTVACILYQSAINRSRI